jgi:hypothetical protein
MGVFMDPAMPPPTSEEEQAVHPSRQKRQDGYCEATAFRLVNEAVIGPTGGSWEHPTAFLDARDRPAAGARNIALMQRATRKSLVRDYLDAGPQPPTGPWGWKDPRNSLTLPYWLALFPEAHILHVRRDGEAIASSLMCRAARADGPSATPAPLIARLRRVATHPVLAAHAIRSRVGVDVPHQTGTLLDRSYCMRLTEQYVAECIRFRHAGRRYMEVRYEEILASPAAILPRLARVAGAEPATWRVNAAAAFVERPTAASQPRTAR